MSEGKNTAWRHGDVAGETPFKIKAIEKLLKMRDVRTKSRSSNCFVHQSSAAS